MKFIKFIVFLFYNYYSDGPTKDVAYIKAISTTVIFCLFQIWLVLLLINRIDILPDTSGDNKGMKYLKGSLLLAPLFLFFFLFVKEKELKVLSYSEQKIKKSSVFLWSYFILSFVLMIILMLVKLRP